MHSLRVENNMQYICSICFCNRRNKLNYKKNLMQRRQYSSVDVLPPCRLPLLYNTMYAHLPSQQELWPTLQSLRTIYYFHLLPGTSEVKSSTSQCLLYSSRGLRQSQKLGFFHYSFLVPCPGDYGIRIIWGGGLEEGKRNTRERKSRDKLESQIRICLVKSVFVKSTFAGSNPLLLGQICIGQIYILTNISYLYLYV